MLFLQKLYHFNSDKTAPKREIYVGSHAIDFFQLEGTGVDEGTKIITNTGLSVKVDGLPESVNQIGFDGLFFKCTMQTVEQGFDKEGKKTAEFKECIIWINPDNIFLIQSIIQNTAEVRFRSTRAIILKGRMLDVVRGLIEHNKKYKERKKLDYGKQPEKAGF